MSTYLPDVLIRRRHTAHQGHLSALARSRNVSGAFVLNERHRAAIAGQHVVLIDDVATTTATLNACAKLLVRYGAKQVTALVVARASKQQHQHAATTPLLKAA